MRDFNPQSLQEAQQLVAPGTEHNRYYRMVTSYWEMATACMLQGAIDEALFLETSGEFMMVWRKVSPWIAEWRAERQQPHYLRNVEQAAKRMQAYRAHG